MSSFINHTTQSTLINTLFSTELSAKKDYRRRHAKQLDKTTEIEIIKALVLSWIFTLATYTL